MVENRPFLTWFSHLVVFLGVVIIAFPVWMTFVASTHDQVTMLRAPVPLLPALIYAALAATFFASLRSPVSVVERAARAIQPAAPDFIARYCRNVTAVWAAVFVRCAVAVATAAVAAPLSTWEWIAGRALWTGMAVVVAVEFLVRKTYFRNYWYGGPFERVWSRLFPAEATEMGRRSAAHIREVRRKLGLETRG